MPHPLFTRRPQAPHTNYRCTSCGDLVAVCEPIPCVDPETFRCLGCMVAAAEGKLRAPAETVGGALYDTRDAPKGAFVVPL